MTTITPRNLIYHELIGREVEIISSKDPSHKGIKGRIFDETCNTLLIEKKTKDRVIIPKKTSTFTFKIPNENRVLVKGRIIVGKPENRIKMRKILW